MLRDNSTGAIKIVTQDSVAKMSFNPNMGKKWFKDSPIQTYLNDTFLSTLYNYQDFLVLNSVFDTTEINDYRNRPTNAVVVVKAVGLLNAYEYQVTYSKSNNLATSSNTYLRNNVWCWTLTPTPSSAVYSIREAGNLYDNDTRNEFGVRPVVNLQSSVIIAKNNTGDGTASKPYTIEVIK